MVGTKKWRRYRVLESNAAFFLPDNSMRGPDVAWISRERWSQLSTSEKKSIPHLVPDFIIELQSETDNPQELSQKMLKWMDNGVKLAWLVSPQTKKTTVYFENLSETIPFEDTLDGKTVLLGLEIKISEIFQE